MNNLTLVFALLFLPFIAFNQTFVEQHFPTKDGRIFYQDVIKVDSITSNQLYIKTKQWVTDVYNSNEVVQVDEKKEGLIVIKSFIKKGHNDFILNPKNWYTFTIELKENRYRYTLKDIVYDFDIILSGKKMHYSHLLEDFLDEPGSSVKGRKKERVIAFYKEYCDELNNDFNNIITSHARAMLTSSGNDRW